MTNTSKRERPTTVSRAAGWIGYACILASIAVIALTLNAAGDGFEGWAVLGIVAALVLLVLGVVSIAANFRRRRLRGSGGTSTHEPGVLD